MCLDGLWEGKKNEDNRISKGFYKDFIDINASTRYNPSNFRSQTPAEDRKFHYICTYITWIS